MTEIHHIPEFGHQSDEGHKKQREIAYLSGLSVINALLIGFFTDLQRREGWGLTEPRWIGLLSDFVFAVGWYGLFSNIIYTITMILGAIKYGIDPSILTPTLILFGGIVLFWLDNGIDMYTRHRGLPVYDREVNERPYLPDGEWKLFFLVRFFPLCTSAIIVSCYVLWVLFFLPSNPKPRVPVTSRSQLRVRK